MKVKFKPGIETLLSGHEEWLAGKRVGLVSHLAAVDSKEKTTAELLWNDPEINMTCLFGPEHGFSGKAGPGEILESGEHPDWRIPVYSLYGRSKKPTAAMLKDVDVLVYDIQDIGVRCYTYVSTLKYVLEAAAKYGKEVVVADRQGITTRASFISIHNNVIGAGWSISICSTTIAMGETGIHITVI